MMYVRSFISRLPFLMLFVTSCLWALDPGKPITSYKIHIWNTENGLPSNSIYAVRQTRNGYLWIGTQNGLVRFDGVRFQVIDCDGAPTLKSDVIRALYEDPRGALWIGTESGGLVRFKEGEFVTYPVSTYPALNKIRAINRDRWGNILIGGCSDGLTCFSNGRFTVYTEEDGLPHTRVRAITGGAGGGLRVVTAKGITKWLKPGGFEPMALQSLLPYHMTTCLYQEKEKALWVGTGADGLFRLENGRVAAYGMNEGLPHLTVTCLYEDRAKNIWIGTDGGGLTRMTNGTLSTLSTRNGLHDGSILSICEDREGGLWVGALDGGLHLLRDSLFTTYTTKEGLVNNETMCVVEDRAGDILIGAGGGLSRLRNGVFISQLTAENGLLNDDISCLFEEPSGALRIGTWGGLHTLKNGRLTTLTQKDGLSDNRITAIQGDAQGHTWIGTANGLNRLDAHTGAVARFTTHEGLADNYIELLSVESDGSLLICTRSGLNYSKDGIITAAALPGMVIDRFNCGYRDKNGVTWLGADIGLLRLKSGESTLYTVRDGLLENHVYTVLEDGNGFLWLGGRSGVSRIRKRELRKVALGRVDRVYPDWFNEKDGMKSGWCTGPGCKSRDGRLWFTTIAGVAVLDPNRIKINPPPQPLIEKLVVDGETVTVCAAKGEQPLELKPGKKRLEFYYTGVTFIKPQRIVFKVKLEGYDTDWVDVNHLRSTSYTQLDPGKYTFRITTGNAGGAWNASEASFSFVLKPYFYQTTWFYMLMFLLAFLTVVSLHFFKVSQLRARKEELETEVKIRTRDLEERNTQLETARQNIQRSKELIEGKNLLLEEQSEKLKELDKAKSRFFANISHDFRTPLTLIKGPLEQMLSEKPDKEQESRIKMMLRNSRRLLNLVEQLLELAKFDSGKMVLKSLRQSIAPFVRGIVMCFESLAQQNKVALIFKGDADDVSLYFDPEKLERIMFNLLSNAFNYTPQGGEIGVSVQTVSVQTESVQTVTGSAYPSGCVEIAVRDTGAGIPADRLPHIFDRFYRGGDQHEYARKGTGIGLALTKELVELHHGEIEVRSNYLPDNAGGTIFTLRLPLGDAHLKPEEISDAGSYPGPDLSAYTPTCAEPVDTGAGAVKPGNAKPIILVVDDNADVRTYVRGTLEPHFNVTEAADGKEGIRMAGEMIPDLVISDIMMPDTDGYELCARLKKDIKTSHVPIILLTSKASEAAMTEGLETGADDYITKPFNTDLLLVRVKNLIRLRRQLQQKFQQDVMPLPGEVPVSSLDKQFMKDLRDVIEENMSDPEFNVDQLAKKLYMSQSTLYRKIEALTGDTIARFIRSYRLTRAAQLLTAGAGSVTDAAFAVGFSNTAYFSKCFKEKFQRSPSEFKESRKSGVER